MKKFIAALVAVVLLTSVVVYAFVNADSLPSGCEKELEKVCQPAGYGNMWVQCGETLHPCDKHMREAGMFARPEVD